MTEFKFNDAALANLKGKVAIVTGGSSGIGKATVEYCSAHGAKVVSADVNPPQGDLPENVTFCKCDVKSWAEVVNLFDEARKLHGRVDIVCANAGINDREDILRDDLEEPKWDVLEVNLKGVFRTIKAAAYHFRRNDPVGGVIIATASITSYVPAHEGVYQYPSAKYGILGILRSMRRATPRFNTRLNIVAPYLTMTGMRAEKSKQHDYYVNQPVNGPEAIAKAIAALAADDANHGKAVVCVGNRYVETEGTYEKVLPEIVSSEVVDRWNEILQINPFKHMAHLDNQ